MCEHIESQDPLSGQWPDMDTPHDSWTIISKALKVRHRVPGGIAAVLDMTVLIEVHFGTCRETQ